MSAKTRNAPVSRDATVMVAWALMSLVLLMLGSRLKNEGLVIQGSLVAVLALFRALAVNLRLEETYAGFSVRIMTCARGDS